MKQKQSYSILSKPIILERNKISDHTKAAVLSLYENDKLTHLMPGIIGAEYGCALRTRKFGRVCSMCGTPTNFFPYFTQSTVFTQICKYEMCPCKKHHKFCF